MARSDRQRFRVGGHALSVSSLDKVLYPATGTTKADVMHYYLAVADVLLPHVAGRPITRKRWVDGVGTREEPGEVFFRKDLEDSAPEWVPTGAIPHSERTNRYPLADGPAVLAWFAQVAALELHVPQWRFGRNGQPRNPDRLVLDLDPGVGVGLAECAEVATWCREVLDGMDMASFPVTSGSKGIHLYADLDGTHNAETISEVARELARGLEKENPGQVISRMRKADRAGKVFIDWSQNNGSKTTISPYSLRGREHPTVAAPRTWEEIGAPGLAQLSLDEVLERVAGGPDPLAPLGRELDDDGRTGEAAVDRLATYRSMRDAGKTAEPVPSEAPVERELEEGELPSFVIQEHHARSLHWDFRLEHSGVLVSWAVPKGPPLERDVNRLAVMTEDHPLEYGSFEGTIAKGEYGAGEVRIWDAGVYELEKWRDGKEVIAVLHGRPDGGLGGVPRRYAVINAPGMGGDKNWLLRLMNDQPDPDATAVRTDSGTELSDSGTELPGAADAHPDSDAEPSAAEPLSVADLPSPMLATPGTLADVRRSIGDGEDWSFEMKWDGYRILAGIRTDAGGGRSVVLASRNGKDLTDLLPRAEMLADALTGEAAERGGAVLDGELVALDGRGRPDFGLLQAVVKGDDGVVFDDDGNEVELRYIVFDVLQLGPPDAADSDRRSLLRNQYSERREILGGILDLSGDAGDIAALPPAHDGSLAEAEKASRRLDLEGVVAKRSDSTYLPAKRGSAWVKLKTQRHQEVVVIGAREGRGDRAGGIGSLLVAVPDGDGELKYAGRVGTGFSAKQLEKIESRLRRIERKTPPVDDVPESDQSDAWWVTPKLIGEVSLTGRTREGRLRHAVWRGWRDDKEPADVAWEQ